MAKNEFDQTVVVNSKIVNCDGGNGSSRHPNVYLNVGNENKISCPYCSRLFIYETLSVEGEDH